MVSTLAKACLFFCSLAFGASVPVQSVADVPYASEFRIDAPPALASALREASRLRSAEGDPPSTLGGLRRRAAADRETLETLLRASGYFANELMIDIAESVPVTAIITIKAGPLYRFRTLTIEGAPTPEIMAESEAALRALGLEENAAAESRIILAAEATIGEILRRRGYPLVRSIERRATVYHETRAMDVEFRIDAGPAARFGGVEIIGSDRIRKQYVERRVAWKSGQRFDATLVENTRRSLAETGLFDLIRIEPAPAVSEKGEVTMRIEVSERKPRSIGAGARYSTSEGFGVRGQWEHRSLLGATELLRVTAETAQERQGLDLEFRKPDIFTRRLDFVSSLRLARETPRAFRTILARGTIGLEYKANARLRFGSTIETEISRQTRAALSRTVSGRETFRLVGLPSFARYDTTDDLLDPTRGLRAQITVTPTFLLGDNAARFFVAQAALSGYQAFDDNGRTVLAGWATLGSIVGAQTIDVPSDRRFYAGGGGSVRGYGYQRIGPRDAAGKPVGGRSLIAFGSEIRQRILENWGISGFIEAGAVSAAAVPRFSDRLSAGAGIGVLYYTPIGPVRADIATPINPRRGDSRVHFYLSFGQPF